MRFAVLLAGHRVCAFPSATRQADRSQFEEHANPQQSDRIPSTVRRKSGDWPKRGATTFVEFADTSTHRPWIRHAQGDLAGLQRVGKPAARSPEKQDAQGKSRAVPCSRSCTNPSGRPSKSWRDSCTRTRPRHPISTSGPQARRIQRPGDQHTKSHTTCSTSPIQPSSTTIGRPCKSTVLRNHRHTPKRYTGSRVKVNHKNGNGHTRANQRA